MIMNDLLPHTGSTVPSPEWVTRLPQARQAEQLLIVAGVGKTTAYVTMHQKNADGSWQQLLTTPGLIGKEGLGKTREGYAGTPCGTFHFTCAFGFAPDPGCTAFPYLQVDESYYWSGDPRCYNVMVHLPDMPDLDTANSEHLTDYFVHYQYCLNISYNEEGVFGAGSAIFLHCLGPVKPYTGGCVAIPHEEMRRVMQLVQPNCVVVIDSLPNLSPETAAAWGLDPQ